MTDHTPSGLPQPQIVAVSVTELAHLAHEHCFKAYEMAPQGVQLYMFDVARLIKLFAALSAPAVVAVQEAAQVVAWLRDNTNEFGAAERIEARFFSLPVAPKAEPEWQPIETAPKAGVGFRKAMFVVIGSRVQMRSSQYTTDPYCVWREDDGNFARWPHEFPPTHWMPLPQPPKSGDGS